MATLTLALAQNLGGLGLWAYAVCLAMMSHLALILVGVLFLSVAYVPKRPRR